MKKFMLTVMVGFMVLGGGSQLKADDPSDSFDIMYVYTAEARIKAGGTSAIRNKITTAFNLINESFVNSDMDLRANLVHMEEINYIEPDTTDDNSNERWDKFVQVYYYLKRSV